MLHFSQIACLLGYHLPLCLGFGRFSFAALLTSPFQSAALLLADISRQCAGIYYFGSCFFLVFVFNGIDSKVFSTKKSGPKEISEEKCCWKPSLN